MRVSNILFTASLIGREFSEATWKAALGPHLYDEKQLHADLTLLEQHCQIKVEGVGAS